MRGRTVAICLVVAAATALLPVRSVRAAAPAEVSRPLVWVVAGDSYSSGEGTKDTLKAPAQGTARCARADGRDGRGTTWGLVAKGAADPDGSVALVACSGTTSSYWAKQMTEARGQGVGKPDVVTLSFGGNNIGFADVLTDCIDLNVDLWGFMTSEGCSQSEAELRARIDYLVGNRSDPPEGITDQGTLPELYDDVAAEVAPGGLVVVAGYPFLTEDPSRWGWVYCDGLSKGDASMLRSVAAYLNQQIALQVQAADRRHREAGVTFEWVDTSKVYESASGRHGLCASDEEWINGLTPDAIKTASYHPKQQGYTGLGREVAMRVERHAFPVDETGPPTLEGDRLGPLEIGMSYDEAMATGWLGTSLTPCSQLLEIGDFPGDHLHRIDGPDAPEGVSGTADFTDDRLERLDVTGGVELSGGLAVEEDWPEGSVVGDLSDAGFDVRVEGIFEPDDLVTAVAPDGTTYQFFLSGGVTVAIPQVIVCD